MTRSSCPRSRLSSPSPWSSSNSLSPTLLIPNRLLLRLHHPHRLHLLFPRHSLHPREPRWRDWHLRRTHLSKTCSPCSPYSCSPPTPTPCLSLSLPLILPSLSSHQRRDLLLMLLLLRRVRLRWDTLPALPRDTSREVWRPHLLLLLLLLLKHLGVGGLLQLLLGSSLALRLGE